MAGAAPLFFNDNNHFTKNSTSMQEIHSIPLFPLSLVMFPGARYPLHIYEQRYKTLINTCVEEKSTFSINLIERNSIQSVGCIVEVDEVLKRHPNGQMDIVVKGLERLQLDTLDETRPPLLYGSGVIVEDTPEEPHYGALQECLEKHNELIDLVFHNPDLYLDIGSGDDIPFSFKIAQKSGLENIDKQRILADTSENSRIAFLNSFLDEILVQLREKRRIMQIALNDGYIPGFR